MPAQGAAAGRKVEVVLDASGGEVTRAENGEVVGRLGHTNSTIKLEAGIYNVTVTKWACQTLRNAASSAPAATNNPPKARFSQRT